MKPDKMSILAMREHENKRIPTTDGSELEIGKLEIEIPFLSLNGGIRKRSAMLYMRVDAEKPMPAIVVIHYEMKQTEMTGYLQRGWAVVTVVDPPLDDLANVVGDDLHFNNAMLSTVMRLPMIDRARMGIRGGSAGGYQVLMLSIMRLGLCCSYCMSGITNLAYQLGYYMKAAHQYNLDFKVSLPEDKRDDPMNYPIPVLGSIADLFCNKAEKTLREEDPESEIWKVYSPICNVSHFSNPVAFSSSTADVLVPIHQLSSKHAPRELGKTLPQGFKIWPAEFLKTETLRASMDELFPKHELAQFVLSVPEAGQSNPLRFDVNRRFALNVIDEGPVEAANSHFKEPMAGAVDDSFYFESHFAKGAHKTNWLTEEKLLLLAERYAGKSPLFMGKTDTDEWVYGSLIKDREDVLEELSFIAQGDKDMLLECIRKTGENAPDIRDTLAEISARLQ